MKPANRRKHDKRAGSPHAFHRCGAAHSRERSKRAPVRASPTPHCCLWVLPIAPAICDAERMVPDLNIFPDLSPVERAVREALEPARERWVNDWRTWHSVPPYLFHYTTGGGLLGMLKTQKLWASDAACLNDSTELGYAADVIASVMQSSNWPDFQSEVAQRFLSRGSAELVINLQSSPYWTVHVVCFSEDGDLLSQWRGYAGSGEDIRSAWIVATSVPHPPWRPACAKSCITANNRYASSPISLGLFSTT